MTTKGLVPILIWGGFHNRSQIRIFVDPQFLRERSDIYLSERQQKRLWKHFCGYRDCQCGDYRRADIKEGW